MKYSNYIGIASALAIIAICFLPWAFVVSINTTLTGLSTGNTTLGKPGIMNIFMSCVSIILFLIPAIWAKRTNLFVGAFNMAWAFRNYLIVTQCQMGECPVKKPGIYLLLIASIVLLIMTFLPKVDLKNDADRRIIFLHQSSYKNLVSIFCCWHFVYFATTKTTEECLCSLIIYQAIELCFIAVF